jgi:hypothetical protein
VGLQQQQHQGFPEELLDPPTFQKIHYEDTCVSPGFPIYALGNDTDCQNALRPENSFPALCTDPTLLWNCDQSFALQIDTSGTIGSPSELGGCYVPPPPLISPSSSELLTTVLTPTTLQQHQGTYIQPRLQRIRPRSSGTLSPLSTYTSRISSETDFQIDAAWRPQVSSAEGEQHSGSEGYTKVWTMSKAPQQGTAPVEVNRLIHASVYSRIQIKPVSDVEGQAFLIGAAKRFSVLEGKIRDDDILFSYCSAFCVLGF